MKTHYFWLALMALAFPLLADNFPNSPPAPYDDSGPSSPAATQASQEASHFIALIDQGEYGASWLDAGSLLKDVITQEQWAAAMNVLRAPLGTVRARRQTTTRSTEALPFGTMGNFMLVQYSTDFSARPRMTERLILMTADYGQWRVVSYSVQ